MIPSRTFGEHTVGIAVRQASYAALKKKTSWPSDGGEYVPVDPAAANGAAGGYGGAKVKD